MGYETTDCFLSLKSALFPEPPQYTSLTFTARAWAKLLCYINLIGDYEITGFGRIVDDKIVDVKILRQEVKASTVDCDIDAMMEFLVSIPPEQRGQWNLDWHSHVNMGVFASGTDSSNYKEQFLARRRKQFPYIIVNKRQEYYARCYINEVKESVLEIKKEAIPQTEEALTEFAELYKECRADIEKLCTKSVYKCTGKVTTYNRHPQSQDEYDDYYDNYYNRYYGSYYSSYDKGNKLSTTHHGQTGVDDEKKLEKKVEENIEEIDQKMYEEALRSQGIDSDEICASCGVYLATAEEYDRGLCSDCWELMTPEERKAWVKGYNLTK